MIHYNANLYTLQSQSIEQEGGDVKLKVVLTPSPNQPAGKLIGYGVKGGGLWPLETVDGTGGAKILTLLLQGDPSLLKKVEITLHWIWSSPDGNTVEDYYQNFVIVNSQKTLGKIVSEITIADLEALLFAVARQVKYEEPPRLDVNSPFGKVGSLGTPIVVPPPPEPDLPARLPSGLWRAVSYFMLAHMPLDEMALYTDMTPQQIHVWARDPKTQNVMWPGPKYLFQR